MFLFFEDFIDFVLNPKLDLPLSQVFANELKLSDFKMVLPSGSTVKTLTTEQLGTHRIVPYCESSAFI